MFFFNVGRKKERKKERKKGQSLLWLEDLSVLVDWFFLKYLFSPRKINFAKKDKTKSRIEKTHGEGKEPISRSRCKSFGIIISSFALRKPRSNGHSASFARTTARKTARRNLRVVPKRAAFFGSIVAPARTDGTRTSRSKKKNETTLRCIIELQRSLKNKKKGGGQNRCVEIVPAAMRCDATYLDLGGLEAGDGRDLLSSSKHDV